MSRGSTIVMSRHKSASRVKNSIGVIFDLLEMESLHISFYSHLSDLRVFKVMNQNPALRYIALVICVSFAMIFPISKLQASTITLEILEKIVDKQKETTSFPLVANHLVLNQINTFLSSNAREKSLIKSFEHWKKARSELEVHFKSFEAPLELAAVAIVESGFQKINQKKGTKKPSGIWQFIPSTARRLGLRVDKKVDERLNVQMQTAAALKLFSLHYREFTDWNLAILAYNRGEYSVKKAMRKNGVRDSFQLLKSEYRSHLDYLPKVMAVIILMANPELLSH